MTSLPPAQCCIGGHLHKGTPKGEVTDIDGSKDPLWLFFFFLPSVSS